jgi:hypothetical protein
VPLRLAPDLVEQPHHRVIADPLPQLARGRLLHKQLLNGTRFLRLHNLEARHWQCVAVGSVWQSTVGSVWQ